MRVMLLSVVLSSLVGACGSFDDPAFVYDMRVLGAIAEPPEILVPANPDDIDPMALPEVRVCALVADPGDSRQLSYSMVACPKNVRGRCDANAQPQINLGSGTVGDPEEDDALVEICETLVASPGLGEIIERSVSIDSLAGFGAIDIQVGIAVWPAGNNVDEAIYATKKVRFGAALPAERVPNQNPTLESIAITRLDGGDAFDLPLGRCGTITAPVVAPGEELELLPVEPEGAREDYVVPTLDGDVRRFTEVLNYRFYATEGSWGSSSSGGGRDISGMLPPLDVSWTAPTDAARIGDGLDITVYAIQHDERGGQSWVQSCLRVVP